MEGKNEMDENSNKQAVKFQLYGLQAHIETRVEMLQTGIDKTYPDARQACTLATITGRRFNGEVFKAAGISITHPTDEYNAEVGAKYAILDAARNLYFSPEFIYARYCFHEGMFTKIWWSAYQRAQHKQPDQTDLPDMRYELVFI